MTYKLFLDDMRDAPAGQWVLCRSYEDFVSTILEINVPAFISFDHDMADEHYAHLENPIPYDKYTTKTGRDCAIWLVEHCARNRIPVPEFTIHSMNPAGRENIEKIMRGRIHDRR